MSHFPTFAFVLMYNFAMEGYETRRRSVSLARNAYNCIRTQSLSMTFCTHPPAVPD